MRNPVYKGEFIAHRITTIEVEMPAKDGLSVRRVKRRVERPEDEWIDVPVPAIVDAELWQAANILEPAVWSVVCNALLQPDVLIKALEADTFNDHQAQLERQIVYLEQELANKSADDEKLYRAYLASAFDENEYAERRKQLKAESAKLSAEPAKLYPQRASRESFGRKKRWC